jgi:serine phosphatase RsbU (regulator of sigma subunit)
MRTWLTSSFSGRSLVLGAAIKLAVLVMRAIVGNTIGLAVLNIVGDAALVAGAAILAWRLFVDLRRVVLWRVRRKLTLSYIFIGFIPALLIIVFFVITGVLLLNSVSAFVIHNRVAAMQREAESLAKIAAAALKSTRTDEEATSAIARLQAAAASTYPGVSYLVAPAGRRCAAATPPSHDPPAVRPLVAPLDAPGPLPSWVPCDGFTGLVMYLDGPRAAYTRGRLATRAVAWADPEATQTVIVTLPLAGKVARQMEEETGVELRDVSLVMSELDEDKPQEEPPPRDATVLDATTRGSGLLDRPIEWVAFFDATDWKTGHTGSVAAAIRTSVRSLSSRLAPVERVGNISFGQILIILLTVVGGLFLVIQIAALVMGLALARSITGSVHELFVGTERVRRGDFTHKIPIRSRDQLGELAESFNSMTSSIEELLQQKAEKERLEQELRIARNIQMSLLPQTALSVPGLSLTAHCEPAREVGGDYYDFLPLDDKRIALLIADVAGKGTSAALYMAELKGIVLSLAERHASPRDLMLDVNRILARHLDTRSFITMIYAVVDLEAHTLTYTRAGHCPLIYLPGPYASHRAAQILVPDGMVVGLNLDNGEMFERQLEEATLLLGPGDLCLLYTDGITEASNSDGEYFGEARLGELLERHADLSSEELRERILREVRSFAGSAIQQDDMTMLIIKTESVPMAICES